MKQLEQQNERMKEALVKSVFTTAIVLRFILIARVSLVTAYIDVYIFTFKVVS